MALNIIDIAKLAGVSKSTVSRYLNNGYVSVESREKIKKYLKKQDLHLKDKQKVWELKRRT